MKSQNSNTGAENPTDSFRRKLSRQVQIRELFDSGIDPRAKILRRRINERLSRFPEYLGLVSLGSRGLGYAKASSDYDLIVMLDSGVENHDKKLEHEMISSISPAYISPNDNFMGPYATEINNTEIEVWFRNLNPDNIQTQLNSRRYDRLAFIYQTLFAPSTHPNKSINPYRQTAANQFYKLYSQNQAEAEKLLARICTTIASLETLSMRPSAKLTPDGEYRMLRSKVLSRTGIEEDEIASISAARQELWYKHLSSRFFYPNDRSKEQ